MKKLKGWQRDWLELVATVRKDTELHLSLISTARLYAATVKNGVRRKEVRS